MLTLWYQAVKRTRVAGRTSPDGLLARSGRRPAKPPSRTGSEGGAVGECRGVLLRLDPAVHGALTRWASDEHRSANAQIEYVLRDALARAALMPAHAEPLRPRGRPRAGPPAEAT